MQSPDDHEIRRMFQIYFKSHPWHGIAPLAREGVFNVYLELVPTDTVKYEIDKATGHLKVDRPQKYSSLCPTPYGFIPRTFCGPRVGKVTQEAIGRPDIDGDGDPIDICILSERPMSHADVLVTAIPIGGLRMIDRDKADDKIVAVLSGDALYSQWHDIRDVPPAMIDRLRHYFLTYKELPDEPVQKVEITHVYGRDEALAVIGCSLEDYSKRYGDPEKTMLEFFRYLAQGARSASGPG